MTSSPPSTLINSKSTHRFLLLCVLLSLSIGLLTRIPFYTTTDFPLVDGGMFAQAIDELRANQFRLPLYIHYNHYEIPFTYPPLGFYLAALICQVFSLDLLSVIRWLPLFFNLLTILLVVLLTWQLLHDRLVTLYAGVIFPLIPRSYEGLLMGGGVTRSLGFFFALLALILANRYLAGKGWKWLAWSAVTIGAAILTHPEWGITAYLGVAVLLLFKQPLNTSIRMAFRVAVLAALVSAPWWLGGVLRFGPEPFVSAATTSGWLPKTMFDRILTLNFFFEYWGWPLLLGGAVSLYRRDGFLAAWYVLIFFTTPRHAPTPASAPLAILSAIGLVFLTDILATRIKKLVKLSLFSSALPVIVILAVIWFALFSPFAANRPAMPAVNAAQRQAMQWVVANTPPQSSFVILSPGGWSSNYIAEWFPYLTQRQSLATAQGLEWMPDMLFFKQILLTSDLKTLWEVYPPALAPYIIEKTTHFDYVAIFAPQTSLDSPGFTTAAGFEVVYSNSEVVIYRYTPNLPEAP